ncbi:hypothetical protein Agsp01_18050 [Agromyces sp. NBRC 114283]|nr:hypothetical protein Agsp01_18050 [Agromyces sp. NBRC 114283]
MRSGDAEHGGGQGRGRMRRELRRDRGPRGVEVPAVQLPAAHAGAPSGEDERTDRDRLALVHDRQVRHVASEPAHVRGRRDDPRGGEHDGGRPLGPVRRQHGPDAERTERGGHGAREPRLGIVDRDDRGIVGARHAGRARRRFLAQRGGEELEERVQPRGGDAEGRDDGVQGVAPGPALEQREHRVLQLARIAQDQGGTARADLQLGG